MESLNLAGAMHKAGDADSRAGLNPKGKLNISSVITPPHLLDCLISSMNSVSILLLL